MEISIFPPDNQEEVENLMKEIGVDSRGIKIMAPKAISALIRINKLPVFAANILKQESLSLGADTAVSRDALTGRSKYTDCLIMGNFSHFEHLCRKLKEQPYSLNKVAEELKDAISNYKKNNFILELGPYKLNLNSRTHIMGILNLTPDSFSGDGLYQRTEAGRRRADIVEYVQKLVDDGADIIDIGGESSRPGAKPVSVKEELKRVIPPIKALNKKIKVPISVDTYKYEVARQALDNGASIVNDITALRGSSNMASLVKSYKAGIVLMHMRGSPKNMQDAPIYENVMADIVSYLNSAIKKAVGRGIDFKKIIVDPGIGFGKTLKHNLKIISSLSELKVLGRPILIGVSRKSFISQITKQPVEERLFGTTSSNCVAVMNGAKIVRVHDVQQAKEALAVLDSIVKCS